VSSIRRAPVDVFAYVDYACPFSYVGDTLLDRILGETEISARAFRRPLTFLGEGSEGGDAGPEGESRGGACGEREGRDLRPGRYGPEERLRIEREVGVRAAELGIPFRMPERVPDPREPLQASEFAKDLGPDLFRRVHRALFGAVWAEGRDVGRRGELLEVCAAAGADRHALSEALEDARYKGELEVARKEADRYGITGTPAFLFGRHKVVGAAPAEVMRDALARAARDPVSEPRPRRELSTGDRGPDPAGRTEDPARRGRKGSGESHAGCQDDDERGR